MPVLGGRAWRRTPDRGAELRHHRTHGFLGQTALPLQELLAVSAADELEAQSHLIAPDVEALVANDVRVLSDLEQHRRLVLEHLWKHMGSGERLQLEEWLTARGSDDDGQLATGFWDRQAPSQAVTNSAAAPCALQACRRRSSCCLGRRRQRR